MAFSVLKCYEYVMECDKCGVMEILHTGDRPHVKGEELYVHNKHTAIKGALYHQSKGLLLCDKCFKSHRKEK